HTSSQTPAKKLVPPHSRSPRTDGKLGGPGMKARKRGWFVRKAFGATLAANSARTSGNGGPASRGGRPERRAAAGPPGRGTAGRAEGVGEGRVGQGGQVVQHPVERLLAVLAHGVRVGVREGSAQVVGHRRGRAGVNRGVPGAGARRRGRGRCASRSRRRSGPC